jgi:hypothetical protein
MAIHDWTRVDAGIFHHFHNEWVGAIARSLNNGLLPPHYYALEEQIAGGLGPDVLTLHHPGNGAPIVARPEGTIALATLPPQVDLRVRAETETYSARAKAVVVRHVSKHQVVAMIEIVSPGNKDNQHGLLRFVEKAGEMLRAGVHLLVADLFPPGPRDPAGIHKAIWDEVIEGNYSLPPDRPLTLVSYIGGPLPEAFIKSVAVGSALPSMPVFLTTEDYVSLPLEATYQEAFRAVPAFWREVLER